MTRPQRFFVAPNLSPGEHSTRSLDDMLWWTPTLGPTATLAAVQLSNHAATNPATPIDAADLRSMLGLGNVADRFWRTIDRLEMFHVITWQSTDVVTIRTHLPALSPRQIARLPERAALAYQLSAAA